MLFMGRNAKLNIFQFENIFIYTHEFLGFFVWFRLGFLSFEALRNVFSLSNGLNVDFT